MKMSHTPMFTVTVAATLVVLASAASFAVDPAAKPRWAGLERTVTLAELCAGDACSIAYKAEGGGAPSNVVPAR